MIFEEILQIPPYSLSKAEKSKLLTERLLELTDSHKEKCPEYGRMLDTVGFDRAKVQTYEDIPYLPVRLFKDLSLKSVEQDEIVKTMTSSGTTGQSVSKIYLDRATSSNQQKTMVKIVNNFTGSNRMPMIILDCPSVVKDRTSFSARGAGILGFSIFGSKKIYALDDDMKLDVEGLKEFLDKFQGEKIFMFGFTFMVWQHFYKELVRLKDEGVTFDLSNGILIHGGGWKKLINEAISAEEFHARLKNVCGLDRIHDYYGMVEQTGCIYMQCECGHLHASIFSDVIARRPKDFSICDFGEPGILQVVSSLPESYPGHSLLTEDEGVILGEDDCPCGRKGKYFKINGRIAKAEIRGCSDTYAADHSENAVGISDDAVNKITYLVGNREILENLSKASPRKPFAENVIEFFSDVSKKLMSDSQARMYADVVTLGFWLRKASILGLRDRFINSDSTQMIGRGVAFHIAPSNVAVNYAYSLFTGLICGNANVVRIPSKDYTQIRIINKAINDVLAEEKYAFMRQYICLVRYERSREMNDWISSICDTRIIWGGDNTIADIRKSILPARATEITFADRYSLAVIDSEAYLKEENKEKIASDFYNDTYLSDQNACTSPRVVAWTGSSIEDAKALFWKNLYEFANDRYIFQPIQGVDKLSQMYMGGACCLADNDKTCLHKEDNADNLLLRVKASRLSPELMEYRGNSGFFYEYDCQDILELKEFCDDTHCQTIGYFGNKEMLYSLLNTGLKGVDRVVPIGHTMDFDLIWDGYNLVSQLTRSINILA